MDAATLVRHALEALKRPLTLKEALSSVADFRIDRKKKYPLYEILMVTVCAMIDGAKGPTSGALRAKCPSSRQSAIQRPVRMVVARHVRPLTLQGRAIGRARFPFLCVGVEPTPRWPCPACVRMPC